MNTFKKSFIVGICVMEISHVYNCIAYENYDLVRNLLCGVPTT